jgi:hypothetical protein
MGGTASGADAALGVVPVTLAPDVGGNRLCRESLLMAASMAVGWMCRAKPNATGKKRAEGAPHGLCAKRSVLSFGLSSCAASE